MEGISRVGITHQGIHDETRKERRRDMPDGEGKVHLSSLVSKRNDHSEMTLSPMTCHHNQRNADMLCSMNQWHKPSQLFHPWSNEVKW